MSSNLQKQKRSKKNKDTLLALMKIFIKNLLDRHCKSRILEN